MTQEYGHEKKQIVFQPPFQTRNEEQWIAMWEALKMTKQRIMAKQRLFKKLTEELSHVHTSPEELILLSFCRSFDYFCHGPL